MLGAVPASAWAQVLPEESPPVRVHAMLDAGVGRVDYDDFLPAGILSAAALVRLDLAYGLVAARGGVVRYDGTGNLNVQGGLAGSGFTGPWRGLRGEISGSLAVGNHETVGSSGNGQVVARVHAASALRGYWLGGGVGWSSYTSGAGGPVRHLDGGAWLRDGPWRLAVTVQPTVKGVPTSPVGGAVTAWTAMLRAVGRGGVPTIEIARAR